MHADIARANSRGPAWRIAVDIRLGKALETLPQLAVEKQDPFDFAFIDADRTNLAEYFDWAVKLAHAGSVIIVDNVVRKGGRDRRIERGREYQGCSPFCRAAVRRTRASRPRWCRR